MRRRVNLLKSIDWITVLAFLLLISFGWINIYAAEYNEQHQSIFDISQRYGKQMIWILAAIIIASLLFLIDVKFFSFFAYLIYALVILLLLFVLIIGKEIHGARSWFEFGFFNFQPSEFAKIATALAIAKYMSAYGFKMNRFRSVFPLFIFILAPAVLVALQPDLGSAIVFFSFLIVIYREGFSEILVFVGLLFIGLFIVSLIVSKVFILAGLILLTALLFWIIHKQFKHVLSGMLILILATSLLYVFNRYFEKNINNYYILAAGLFISLPFYLAFALRKRLRYAFIILGFLVTSVLFAFIVDYGFNEILKEHQQRRVNILLGIESDPLGMGYNINQSKIAIGSGGITGKGFLNGTQTKFDFVPEQSTDFIFCTVGEEWGFIGGTLVIALFVFLLIRLIWIAERQRSDFSRIYGYGVIAILFTHFVINIGMTIGLLPVIGIPLPFFSYGGSSLWSFTILLFIMLRLDASRMELLK